MQVKVLYNQKVTKKANINNAHIFKPPTSK